MKRRLSLKMQSRIAVCISLAGFLGLLWYVMACAYLMSPEDSDRLFFVSYGMMLFGVLLDFLWVRCPVCGKWIPPRLRDTHMRQEAEWRRSDEYVWMLCHDYHIGPDDEPPASHYSVKLNRFIWHGISMEELDAAMKAAPLSEREEMPQEGETGNRPIEKEWFSLWTLENVSSLLDNYSYIPLETALLLIPPMGRVGLETLPGMYFSFALLAMIALWIVMSLILPFLLLRCPYCFHRLYVYNWDILHRMYTPDCPGCGEYVSFHEHHNLIHCRRVYREKRKSASNKP